MVKRPRWVVPVAAAGIVAVAAWAWMRGDTPLAEPLAAAGQPARTAQAEPDLPRIDLDRLDRERTPGVVGQRNLFDFVVPPPPPTVPPPPTAPAEEGPPVVTVPTPPPLPPLNIKYIGALQNERGLKVAMFMTDRKEIVTGQAGEVVANRFRVMRIGIESVDIQELGSDQVRRIPLKGN